jgi:hypothetical protein
MQSKTVTQSPHLSYPLNIDTDPEQGGHYIMFFINEANPPKLKKGKAKEVDSAIGNFPPEVMAVGDYGLTGAFKASVINDQKNAGAGKAYTNQETFRSAPSQSLVAKRPGSTRMAQAITLYMPPSVKVSYKMKYADPEIGALAQAGGQVANTVIDAFTKGNLMTWTTGAKVGGHLGEGATAMGLTAAKKTADMLAPGSPALAQIQSGAILGSKMEVLFEGVGRREFSFTFAFLPKSEKEAQEVEKIIYTFKKHMHPSYANEIMGVKLSQGRILKIPDTFDIQYMFTGNKNEFLNKISTCYLTNCEVDYGGDKFAAYELSQSRQGTGAPPQRSSITLSFTEIEIITRERIEQGF